jgi:hypothetical protein
MFVSTLQLLSNLSLLGSSHLPGIEMGDIDHESRKEDHILAGDYSVPSLLPELFIDLEADPVIISMIADCSPFKAIQNSEKNFHDIFLRTQKSLVSIFPNLAI